MRTQYSNPFDALKSGLMLPGELQNQYLLNALNEFKRQQEEQRAPHYGELAQSEADLANLAPKEHKQKMYELEQEMQYRPRRWESEMALQGAQTGHLGAQTRKIGKEVEWYDRNAQDEHEYKKALTGHYGAEAQKTAMIMNMIKRKGQEPDREMGEYQGTPVDEEIMGNYGVTMPKPTQEDMQNKFLLGNDTYGLKVKDAMEQKKAQEKSYQAKIQDINTKADTSRSFLNLVEQYDYYMNKASTTGPILGKLPAWGPDAAQAQGLVEQMTPAAVADMRAAMQSGQFAVADLNASLRQKPQLTWTEGQRKNYLASRRAIADRLDQQRQFYMIANNQKIPTDLADSAWQLYQNQYKIYDKTGTKVVKRKGNEWQQYLSPEALKSIRMTGDYKPSKYFDVSDEELIKAAKGK